MVEDLEPQAGELDKEEYHSQCFIDNLESDVLQQLRKFRLSQVPGTPAALGGASSSSGNAPGGVTSGCLQTVRQRWVEWYRHMHNLDLFKLNDIETMQNEKLRMSQMLSSNSAQDPDLSEESDEEADTKYNLLDYEDGCGG